MNRVNYLDLDYRRLKKFSKNEPCIIKDFFESGLSYEMGLTEDDVDPEQLSMGIRVEMEHTGHESIAKKIALDHLAEDPKYYTKLKKMEGK
jgi:hypothetical protein